MRIMSTSHHLTKRGAWATAGGAMRRQIRFVVLGKLKGTVRDRARWGRGSRKMLAARPPPRTWPSRSQRFCGRGRAGGLGASP